MYTHRAHTNLTEQVPETDRMKYGSFLMIVDDGTYSLTQAYKSAIKHAEDEKTRILTMERAQSDLASTHKQVIRRSTRLVRHRNSRRVLHNDSAK